jgi:raffinose/stachyose/melibiose transport system permease protein
MKKMDKILSNKWWIALYVLPSLILLLTIIYLPIVLTAFYGLMDWNGIGQMTFVGLDQYATLLHDEKFWGSVNHSLIFALLSTGCLALYMAVALVLTSRIRGASLFRKIYLIPMLLSSVAIAQLWLKIYHPTSGILNEMLDSLGVKETPNWLADPAIVLWSLFIPILWQYAGFYILIYYSAFMNIPVSLVEAARMDGASGWQIAVRIKIPLIVEVIKVTVVLAVVGSLKYFDLIYVMTGGGPNGASEVMASYMYNKAFKGFDFGYGSAIAFSLLILCLAATWVISMLTASKEKIQYS